MSIGDLLLIFGRGVLGTISLFGATLVLCLILGAILAVMRVSPVRVFRGVGTVYVTVLRNTPSVLVLFFCAFGLPYLAVKFSDNSATDSFVLAVIGMSVYTAAFVCEVFRSGISTVPVGQSEAARSIGLGFFQSLNIVILPQAIRTVVPPLASVIITMLKTTAIASAFNNREIIYSMKQAIELRGDLVMPILLAAALVYIVLNLILGRIFAWIEKKAVILR